LEDLGRCPAFLFQSHHIYSANWILRFPASSFLFSPEFDWSSCIWSPLLMPHEKVHSPSKCHKCQPKGAMAPWYSPLQGSGISKKGSRYICSGVCKWKWVQSLWNLRSLKSNYEMTFNHQLACVPEHPSTLLRDGSFKTVSSHHHYIRFSLHRLPTSSETNI
jgi:hypothetical protein